MKVRKGFVSNSSSSSFVIMKAGQKVLGECGDPDCSEDESSIVLGIDELIAMLNEAKAEGATKVTITGGGGYEG